MEILVEIHSYYQQQVKIAKQVDRVYDFALPPLILNALFKGESNALAQWLSISPRNAITVLDTHDGIGVIDVGADAAGTPGLLPLEDIDNLVETIHARSNGESRQATGASANNLDLYQVNCTYYDALGRRDDQYLIARAVQFFAPGVPQVYYVGLMAGENDMDLLGRSRVGRDINRHFYTPAEVEAALARPVVQRLLELIRFRNSHPAFQGAFKVEALTRQTIHMRWSQGSDWAELDVNFAVPEATLRYTSQQGMQQESVGLIQEKANK